MKINNVGFNGVIGVTHVDIAWKKDMREMSEIFESVIVRLLDLLEQYPEFTYVIEQACLFVLLQERRPDLIEKMKPYVLSGRVEIVGGMASTAETNTISGECLIRNTRLGQQWFEKNLGKRASVGWLIDTFGVNAQYPQLAKKLGYSYLFANRLGGNQPYTMIRVRGIDGTEIPLIGRDVYSPAVLDDGLAFQHVNNWCDYDKLFKSADEGVNELPLRLFMPYTENEIVPSIRSQYWLTNMDTKRRWIYTTPHAIQDLVSKISVDWPVLSADLNPEFTGTFSNRIKLRFAYRQCEQIIQQLRSLLALCNPSLFDSDLLDQYDWGLAYIQAHDMITGSHPTAIYNEGLDILQKISNSARFYQEKILSETYKRECLENSFTVYAGDFGNIPVPISLPVKGTVETVHCNGQELSFIQKGNSIEITPTFPSFSLSTISYTQGKGRSGLAVPRSGSHMENSYMAVDVDLSKKHCTVIKKDVSYKISLLMQEDVGNFQIEEPKGSEMDWTISSMTVSSFCQNDLYQELVLEGAFPKALFVGVKQAQRWSLLLRLYNSAPYLEMIVSVPWNSESSRIRLKISTSYVFPSMVNEIPFGTVHREYYRERGTAKGEWPVLRFAVAQSDQQGVCLVNTGNCGVECRPKSLYTTLIRSPQDEYAGMYPDDTSSQHGLHIQRFALLPFEGDWVDSSIYHVATIFNEPPVVVPGTIVGLQNRSLIEVSNSSIVVSAVEVHGLGYLLRLYEASGRYVSTKVSCADAGKCFLADLEGAANELLSADGSFELSFKPFEIRTVYISKQ